MTREQLYSGKCCGNCRYFANEGWCARYDDDVHCGHLCPGYANENGSGCRTANDVACNRTGHLQPIKTERRMKIYVSLPITGYDLEERKERASELKRRFEREGHEAVTPFDLDWEEGKDYAHYMGRDIEALLRCDAVYFNRGWKKSKGCCLEYWAAKIYKKILL